MCLRASPGGKVYWADISDGTGKLNVINTDGTNNQVVAPNIDRPRGLFLDGDMLYVGTER